MQKPLISWKLNNSTWKFVVGLYTNPSRCSNTTSITYKTSKLVSQQNKTCYKQVCRKKADILQIDPYTGQQQKFNCRLEDEKNEKHTILIRI